MPGSYSRISLANHLSSNKNHRKEQLAEEVLFYDYLLFRRSRARRKTPGTLLSSFMSMLGIAGCRPTGEAEEAGEDEKQAEEEQ